jgi:nonsense-mediated mRNA decay protein 3
LEEDSEYRKNVNIFKNSDKIPVDTSEIDPVVPQITLAEMLDDLVIEDIEMVEIHE